VYVPDLTAYDVSNIREVEQLIEQGRQNRHTFATNMNEHSSRSHSVLMVNVHGRNVLTGVVARGKLNLVDLAGSERISKSEAVGLRLKEAQVATAPQPRPCCSGVSSVLQRSVVRAAAECRLNRIWVRGSIRSEPRVRLGFGKPPPRKHTQGRSKIGS
jgi:hypothetical protein